MTNIIVEYEVDRKGKLTYSKPFDYIFNEELEMRERQDTSLNCTKEELDIFMSRLVEKGIIELQYPTVNGILEVCYDSCYLEYDFCVNYPEIEIDHYPHQSIYDFEKDEEIELDLDFDDIESYKDKEKEIWTWYHKEFKLSEL